MKIKNSRIVVKTKFIDSTNENRSFYDCSASYNWANYVTRDHGSTNELTFNIIDSKGNKLNINQIKEKLSYLTASQTLIWDNLISFRGDEKIFNIFNEEDSFKFIKKSIEGFNDNKLNFNNIDYLTCYHDDTEHRHIHFLFWQKQPEFLNYKGEKEFLKKGKISIDNLNNFKELGEKWLIENYYRIYNYRDEIINSINCSDDNILNFKLKNLSLKLNKVINYNSKNLDNNLKRSIDNIANYLLTNNKNNSLFNDFKIKLQEREELLNKTNNSKFLNYSEKIIKDLYSRIGNKIIKTAVSINNNNSLYNKKVAPLKININNKKTVKYCRYKLKKSFYQLTNNLNDSCVSEILNFKSLLNEKGSDFDISRG